MATRTQFILTTGVSGSGKTYRRCAHYLAKEFLPDHSGVHVSNFPVNLEELQKYCDSHGIKCDVKDRVKLIPQEELTKWLNGESGPWDYFEGWDLSGVHFALDEAHNFCSKKSKPFIRERWARWLGELRHMGMTAEFLTQNEGNMANEVMNQCEIRLEIINGENRIDPLLHIRMSDWYELKAKIFGKYIAPSYELEYMQMKGRWKVQTERKFYREAEIFRLYDSFNKPVQGGSKGESEKRHFERYGWFRFICWFVGSNFSPLLRAFLVVALFGWLVMGGGVGFLMKNIINGATGAMKGKHLKNKTEKVEINDPEEIRTSDRYDYEKNSFYNDFGELGNSSRKVMYIGEKYILFDDAVKIRVNDDLFGFRVVAIDYRNRRVLLDDMNLYDVEELKNWIY